MNADANKPGADGLPPEGGWEARLTARLLGELSEAESTALDQAVASDPELARLEERLRRTLGFVREAAAQPAEPALGTAALPRMSAGRRERLLEKLRSGAGEAAEAGDGKAGTAPPAAAAGTPAGAVIPVAFPGEPAVSDRWRGPGWLAAAAVVVGILLAGTFLLETSTSRLASVEPALNDDLWSLATASSSMRRAQAASSAVPAEPTRVGQVTELPADPTITYWAAGRASSGQASAEIAGKDVRFAGEDSFQFTPAQQATPPAAPERPAAPAAVASAVSRKAGKAETTQDRLGRTVTAVGAVPATVPPMSPRLMSRYGLGGPSAGAPASVASRPDSAPQTPGQSVDAGVTIALGATDTEGEALSYRIVQQPARGRLRGTADESLRLAESSPASAPSPAERGVSNRPELAAGGAGLGGGGAPYRNESLRELNFSEPAQADVSDFSSGRPIAETAVRLGLEKARSGLRTNTARGANRALAESRGLERDVPGRVSSTMSTMSSMPAPAPVPAPAPRAGVEPVNGMALGDVPVLGNAFGRLDSDREPAVVALRQGVPGAVDGLAAALRDLPAALPALPGLQEAAGVALEGRDKENLARKQAVAPPPSAPVPQPEVASASNNLSTFSLNVSDVSFKLAGASLDNGQLPGPATVRTEEFLNAFEYRDPEPAPDRPVAFAWERARFPFAQQRDVLRLSVRTGASGREAGRPMNLVLLLDASGSMERADRVAILREALGVLGGQLEPQDRVSVVTFARTPRLRIDGLPGDQASNLAERVGEWTPEGGTHLEDALRVGYATALKHFTAEGPNRVVLLTDGAANLGELRAEALRGMVASNRERGIALDCFGIGFDGYQDELLEALSRNGDGRYGFVNSPEEAATGFANQLAGALNVAASDVKVQVEFNPERVNLWRQIGYAKHQLTREQFRDNTVDAAEIGAAESGNALYVIEPNARGHGPIGTVRVRYRDPASGTYSEHAWAVPYDGPALPLEAASPALRLATTAASFGELLSASPYAADVSSDRLLALMNGVPEHFAPDPRPERLLQMVQQTQSLLGR